MKKFKKISIDKFELKGMLTPITDDKAKSIMGGINGDDDCAGL